MAYQRIFVAIDDSPATEHVVEKALEIAAKNSAELYVGHVVNTGPIEAAGNYPPDLLPQMREEFDEKTAALIEKARSYEGVKAVHYKSEVGPIRETLLEKLIQPCKPDLVVCGARGLSPLKYALLGSISNFIVKHAGCDVLVVRDIH